MTEPHIHDWQLTCGDERARYYHCADEDCTADLVVPRAATVMARHGAEQPERKPIQVGDRATIGYGHDSYPGASGVVTAIRHSKIEPEVRFVEIAITVLVMEEELR